MLKDLNVDMIEVSCGSSTFSYMNMCRGEVPVKEMVQSMPFWKKPVAWFMLNSLKGKYDLEEGYNTTAARSIRSVTGDIPLAIVGGMRTLDKMSQAVIEQDADLISMSRPFIREPFMLPVYHAIVAWLPFPTVFLSVVITSSSQKGVKEPFF